MRRRRATKASHRSAPSDSLRLADAYDALRTSGQLVKLHVGCGPRVLKDWINIDKVFEPFEGYLQYYTNRHYGPDVRGTEDDFFAWDVVDNALPLPDDSVDVIFHEDFLEHLSQRDQYLFLAETRRVLKPEGLHRISTPNLAAIMEAESDFTRGFSGVFVQEWDANGHLFVHTEHTLTEMARTVGYTRITMTARDRSRRAGDLPTEYRPDERDRPFEGANLFVDLQL